MFVIIIVVFFHCYCANFVENNTTIALENVNPKTILSSTIFEEDSALSLGFIVNNNSIRPSTASSKRRYHRSTTVVKRAHSDGDVIIGGLFPVHIPDNGVLCGKLQIGAGMWTESMIYAINVINKHRSVLPNTVLGYDIRDDCSDTNQALQQTLNFISINTKSTGQCSKRFKTVRAVVGTGKSSTSKAVSDLLTLFNIPQISYSASASEFSKKYRFPYFFRTVPSDKHQARVMCDIAVKYKWNLVDIIYSNDNYGMEGREELERNFRAADICVSESLTIYHEHSSKVVVNKLKKSKSKIIFTFCGKDFMSKILEESSIQNMTGKTWIACDSWANSKQVVADYKHIVQEMLGVLPVSGLDDGFKKYLLNIDPLTNINPFYQDTLETLHNCSFSDSIHNRQCSSSDTFEQIANTSYVWSAFVIDAVYALAYALDDLYRNNGSYKSYAEYIKNVSFEGVTSHKFEFDRNGDPRAKYQILQTLNGQEFQKVAEWDPAEGFLKEKDKWKNSGINENKGRCSSSCPPGTYQKVAQDLTCCWTCEPCQGNHYTRMLDEKVCISCEDGFNVNKEHTNCTRNQVIYLQWSSMITSFLILLVILGMILTLVCLIVFVKYQKTPTIKATSTELSYVLIIGILFSFSCTLMFMGEPTDFICNARLVMMGVSFSIYVGALLMKTNRISRIFNRKLSDGRPSVYLNIKYQILFIFVIVMTLVVIQAMLIYASPSQRYLYRTTDFTYIQCKHSSLAEPLIVIVYNLTLALLCGYQAFRIRKLPGQFNDSKSISFTILTCCLIWFIFLASIFTRNGYIKSIISCVGFISNGLAALCCMFFPKVWLIYMHPEMNVKQSTINMKNASRVTITALSGSCTHYKKTEPNANLKQSAFTDLIESSTELSGESCLEDFEEKLKRKKEVIAFIEIKQNILLEKVSGLYKWMNEVHNRYEKKYHSLFDLYQDEQRDVSNSITCIGLNDSQALQSYRHQYNFHETSYNCSLDKAMEMLESIGRMRQQGCMQHSVVENLLRQRNHLQFQVQELTLKRKNEEDYQNTNSMEMNRHSDEDIDHDDQDTDYDEQDTDYDDEEANVHLIYSEYESNL